MVSPMFDYNPSIRMDRFVRDRDRMKTPGEPFPWAAYLVPSFFGSWHSDDQLHMAIILLYTAT